MPKLVTADLSNNAEPCVLRYTTSDNQMLKIKEYRVISQEVIFDAKIISHYYDNEGQIIFDKPITSIGNGAFEGFSNLIDITIPDSVTKIGDFAFRNCNNLANFYGKFTSNDNRCLVVNGILKSFAPAGIAKYNIPNNITSIGKWAFCGCTSLTSIIIPNSVTSIGDSAFSDCTSLTSITIPDSVTSIGGWAFSNCTSLTSAHIPNSLNKIGDYAFYWCRSLNNIAIPDSVTEIRDKAFFGCCSIKKITIEGNIDYFGKHAFYDCGGELTINCNTPNVPHFEDGAFYNAKFTKVIIGNHATTIGNHAFSHCSSLTSLTIPDSVVSIGWGAFAGCRSLASIFILDLSAWCKIDFCDNPLYNADLYLNGELVTDVIIPSNIKEINSAFLGCKSLTNVTIPNNVTTINDLAFLNCRNLQSIIIGNNVTTIGNEAFEDCSSLINIVCRAIIPPMLGYSAFDNIPKDATIIIPEGCEEAYMNSDWRYLFEE